VIFKHNVVFVVQNRASDPPKYKGTKELMPASMRVKDAAEAVLTCIIDTVVGVFASLEMKLNKNFCIVHISTRKCSWRWG
jgi:hypothetical protein